MSELEAYAGGGGQVAEPEPGRWELRLPPGKAAAYRLAQLDDYATRHRRDFPHRPPLRLALRARVSSAEVPGTWGFGLWNDPFGLSLTVRGSGRRLPTLPQAAWFFHASPPNHLAFRDDRPGQGFLAATFSSLPVPSAGLALASPLAVGLLLPVVARGLRRLARRLIHEDAALLEVDATSWHRYELLWLTDRVRFLVDGAEALETPVVPRGPLGLVLWIDNQYAAFTPEGKVRFGSLAGDAPVALELEDLAVYRAPR